MSEDINRCVVGRYCREGKEYETGQKRRDEGEPVTCLYEDLEW